MSEFEQSFTVQLLPYGASSPTAFKQVAVHLDPLRHTCSAIKELLGIRGLLCHGSTIVPDEGLLKNWYDSSCPIVVVASSADWEETESWSKNPNPIARLLNCHAPVESALVAVGRCYWQEGFHAFFNAATILRNLVDLTGTFDYQRRAEFACMTRQELNPVMLFNEYSGKLLPPPRLRGDAAGGDFLGEWVDIPRPNLSTEERDALVAEARSIQNVSPDLEEASRAVVRLFGYHSLADEERIHVTTATAFFVAPGLLMSTRTATFCKETNTFAHTFRYTRRTRALHGVLEPGIDLFDVKPLPDLTETLVTRVRALGISLDDTKVPPGMFAAPWCDVVLFEVVDPRQKLDCVCLLPEIGHATPLREERVYAIAYSDIPSNDWTARAFGAKGNNCEGKVTSEHLRTQWWSHDVKCCSVGQVHEDFREEEGVLKHTCTLLPGARGAPLLRRLRSVHDGTTLTFAGMACGRSDELFEREADNIIGMSTSDLARRESLASNVFNDALPATHLTFVLLYQEAIPHRLTDPAHRAHVRKFLAPYDIFTDDSLLSRCHETMLLDADDHNEYGMDFYTHHDLANALACFREGAKMFSTASIPNLSEHDVELKTALQTNVSAVVVARMNLVQ